jgi:hypothetical protein
MYRQCMAQLQLLYYIIMLTKNVDTYNNNIIMHTFIYQLMYSPNSILINMEISLQTDACRRAIRYITRIYVCKCQRNSAAVAWKEGRTPIVLFTIQMRTITRYSTYSHQAHKRHCSAHAHTRGHAATAAARRPNIVWNRVDNRKRTRHTVRTYTNNLHDTLAGARKQIPACSRTHPHAHGCAAVRE